MTVTKGMVLYSFKCFKAADIVNVFPMTLDLESYKFSYEKSKLTTVTHSVAFGILSMKCFQLVYALIIRFIGNEEREMAVTIVTCLWGSLCLVTTFWAHELFHNKLSETILLFNSLDFKRNGHEHTKKNAGASWTKFKATMTKNAKSFSLVGLIKKMWRMGLQELLLLACPYAITMFVPTYLATMALFPHWSVFAMSLVEVGTWAYSLAIGVEVVSLFCIQSNIQFLFFFELAMQVVHLGNLTQVTENRGLPGFESMNSVAHLDTCIETFDFFHVIVRICNVLFSRILFTGKLMALSCSIFSTYYILTHYSTASPMLLFFVGAVCVNAIAFYVISCQKLFEVPGAMRNVKSLCTALLQDERTKLAPWDFKVRECKINAMPALGISDGGFRYMDSISTLIFIDFYLNQVISLLLM